MNIKIVTGIFFIIFILATEVSAQTVTTLTPESFIASGDLAVDSDGNIFVANFGSLLNNANGTQVYKVTPEGEVSVFASGLSGASGNTFDSEGNLYQSSIAGNRVSKITPDGTVTTFADAADGVSNPVGLTFDSAGNLFVANCNGSILRLTPAGVGSTLTSGGLLSCPNGLTSDDQDNLYAANFNNGTIVKITPQGTTSSFARTPAGPTKPAGGNGHIIYANERLYVVSNASQQLFEIDITSAEMTLIAGTGTKGRADGSLLDSSFSLPNGIDVSPDGTLVYINDSEQTNSDNNISPNVVRVVKLPNITPPFSMNAGLNDAWFNPVTNGQGFFITVFPNLSVVSLAWFTYDTTLPDTGATANLGDPGHRWITALGSIDGNQSVMDISVASGGIFDTPTDIENESIGTITLSFEDCNKGTLDYDIPSIGRQGTIPIQRVANDNATLCEALIP